MNAYWSNLEGQFLTTDYRTLKVTDLQVHSSVLHFLSLMENVFLKPKIRLPPFFFFFNQLPSCLFVTLHFPNHSYNPMSRLCLHTVFIILVCTGL